MLTTYCDLTTSGVEIIIDNLRRLRTRCGIDPTPQDATQARYYTFPTRSELDAFTARGLRLVDPVYMRNLYLSSFSTIGTAHYEGLAGVLDEALEAFYRPR